MPSRAKDHPNQDEETVGNWMIEWELKELVKHRIACDELNYSLSEAHYSSIEDWENQTGGNWTKDVLEKV